MLGYAVSRGLPAHAILTKADKLGRGAQGNALLAVRKLMQAEYGDAVSVQLFRSEEHTSELQSLMRISYAVFCLKQKLPVHTHSTLPRLTHSHLLSPRPI